MKAAGTKKNGEQRKAVGKIEVKIEDEEKLRSSDEENRRGKDGRGVGGRGEGGKRADRES